jgi:hypothetical protein
MSIFNPKLAPNKTIGAIGGTINNVISGVPLFDSSSIIGGIGNVIGREVGNLLGGLLGFAGIGQVDSLVRLSFKPGHPYAGYPGILSPLAQTGGMIFPYRPTMDISRTVNYENVAVVHGMQDFKSFRNNSSATINITGQYTAQTVDEARYLQAAIHFLRTASLMSFGRGGRVPAGMPPPVLNLSAFGPNNLNNVPVVLDAVTTSYPNDVDYIRIDGNDIAVLQTITTQCTVQLSPAQLRNFSLDAFASGNMQGYI